MLLAEAAVLGVTIADLVAAAEEAPSFPEALAPTVAAYVEEVAPTSPAARHRLVDVQPQPPGQKVLEGPRAARSRPM